MMEFSVDAVMSFCEYLINDSLLLSRIFEWDSTVCDLQWAYGSCIIN